VLIAELIRKKRDGGELTAEEIDFLVAGITDGTVTDAQGRRMKVGSGAFLPTAIGMPYVKE
jgi:hypothetical protein